ncbi:Lrp/AsnC family transcriptional regulator [Microbacterium sp. CFH 90308]|uniref:Lrp/AsnC family transcriptional regulator n=1 Tax=Microbacterium salsuginis TaxID=2722803 RepID=A0ABX1K750_9MICO|nr:Lrp/AsnC family transcriptional regulator [Microbacterium sp. CFH 90308]NLP82841.1 Lrp/AsnC family transcriptional regulator [Microbacterium sp. CFH 90308]
MTDSALDRLTDLDKRIIVALQRDGRASWRAIAEAVSAPVSTVSRRGQQLIAEGVARIVAVPALDADGPHAQFFVRINCAPGTQMAVAEQLIRDPDVRFCTVVTGSYDIMAELVVRGGATHYPQLAVALQPIAGVERWRSDLVMHVYKVSFDWGRQLYEELVGPSEEAGRPHAGEPETCSPDHFDQADRDILAMLKEDGRETFQRIADRLGLNESSVRRRFERLRASRCVDIVTLVQSAALGMGAETFLTVKVSPDRIDAVAQELARYPFVRYLAALLDDNALLCEVITTSVDDLFRFVTDSLAHLEGVEGWTANMELLFLKRGFVETPWWRAQVGMA